MHNSCLQLPKQPDYEKTVKQTRALNRIKCSLWQCLTPLQNTSMMNVHPKKGSCLPASQLTLLSRSRTVVCSSPFLEQWVSLSNPISRLTWKQACSDFSLHMETIKLFLHEKQILYFLKNKNNHCNKHRSQAFQVEEGVTWKYKKQLSPVEQSMWAEWGVKHNFRQQVNKKLKRGWEGGMQGNLELFNAVNWEGGESTSAVTPLEPGAGTHWGNSGGNPTLLSLMCREQFSLRLLLLPPCRVEEKGFPNTWAWSLQARYAS